MIARLLRGVARCLAAGRSTGSTDVVFECRRCGTTVRGVDDRCPVCRSADIASYEVT